MIRQGSLPLHNTDAPAWIVPLAVCAMDTAAGPRPIALDSGTHYVYACVHADTKGVATTSQSLTPTCVFVLTN